MDRETVTYIIQLLHTNGLYAAEDALLRELEERCPEPAGMQPFLPDPPEHTAVTFHASVGVQQEHAGLQEQSTHQSVQDRHPPSQDEFGAQGFNSSPYPPADQAAEPSPSGADRRRVAEAEWDEYIDEEDPGYIREDIRGQDAFVARELDVSDADGSRRAMDLYHQAMDPPAQQEWVQGEDEERSSSDGRGSSYFSGERLDQGLSSTASPMHSQQSLTGHVDRASLAERTVVLAEPVYPADSPARSTHSASRAGSTSGDLGCLGAPPPVPGTAEVQQGPQRSGAENDAQIPDAATTRAAAIAVAASSGANFHKSASSRDDGHHAALSSSAPEHSSRSFLDPLGIVEKVSDVFSRRVQPRSDSETSKHSTANATCATAAKASQQAPLDQQQADVRAEPETLASTVEQNVGEDRDQQHEGAVPAFKLRVKAPEAHRAIRTSSGASGAAAKASGSLDPASPSGISEEDENFSFPLTPPSEPAAPAAVFSSWHSFRKRSSKGYDTDDDLSMGRVSDFSVEPSQESNSGYPHSGVETQHTLQNAAGRSDSVHTADSSGEGSKHRAELQPATADSPPLAVPGSAVESPSQPSLRSEASLARNITLGKPGMPDNAQLGSEEHDLEGMLQPADCSYPASASHSAGAQRRGSAEGTEMLPMSSHGQQADAVALLCSSPPREAWPSILLQPQSQSAPAQAPMPASMQLPDSSAPAAETPFPSHPPHPIPEEKALLAHAPFGSSVMPRAGEDSKASPAAPSEASTVADPPAAQHSTVQQEAATYARVPSKDLLVTPSRLSRASSAMCGDASQPMPPTPMSTAAECSSPPSMAAVHHAREDGRAAGMRGIAHSSMSSLDGVTTSQRDREAAAKARASLDFSSLSDRAAKGARPPASQRAQSAEIPGKSKQQSQMLAAVQPLDVSLSLSQHELENLQKDALQRRKPPPLTPLADDAPSHSAAEAQHAGSAGHNLQCGHPLAGGSPAASVAVHGVNPPAASEQASDSGLAYEYDPDYIERKYEILELKVIHRRRRTGFEETKDFPIRVDDLIAGRYQVMDFLGSAAFSRAVQALDVKTRRLVCLKIIKNNKDYFDQSLDEIKLLSYINSADPMDEHGLLRLYDYFYYKEHLFLVCELLRANLYEFQKYNRDSGNPPYFVLQRVQSIARQAYPAIPRMPLLGGAPDFMRVLTSLAFLHSLGLIHSDLKPENILIKSYSRCEVKVIDFGSSCFTTDQLSSYVQSRSYRGPEVILGLPYGQKVDVWSLGCILAELLSGYVLFQNDSLATLLARLEGILGPVPQRLLSQGRYTHRFYTRSGALFERNSRTHRYEYLHPKQTSIGKRVPEADEGCRDFLLYLLTVDPQERPTAEAALQHPWLQHQYPAPPIQ